MGSRRFRLLHGAYTSIILRFMISNEHYIVWFCFILLEPPWPISMQHAAKPRVDETF